MSAGNNGVCLVQADDSTKSLLDQSITRHFLKELADCKGKIVAEYVWIGGSGHDLRSKARTLTFIPTKPEVGLTLELPCCYTHTAC